MGMDNFTASQQKIIKRYYDNIDQISLQRLSELVADLYLADTAKKQEKLWKSAVGCMEKLAVAPARIAHLVAQKKPELVANLVKELMND